MKYVIGRALYFYFLMREVTDADAGAWVFIARHFGVKPKDIKTYEKVLENRTLEDLTTTDDIEMYKNYLNGFWCKENEFGKSECEQEAITAKALALHKMQELFGDVHIRGNRLRSLSYIYERDHKACVLYALQVLYLNSEKECGIFAEEILKKELKEGKNSDAGLILLARKCGNEDEIVSCLKGLPDMLLCPDMQKYLTKQYGKGSGEVIYKDKRTIGFGGGKL